MSSVVSASRRERIDRLPGPPSPLIANAVGGCELVADLHAEGSPLSKAHMMGVHRPATADQVRLLRHELEMLLFRNVASGL
jgi:hypothetical protein